MFFNFSKKFILPKSHNEDLARREFILNILLLVIIFLLTFVTINNTIRFFGDPVLYKNNVFPVGVVYLIFSFFVFLYFLSRKGFSRFASYSLLAALFLPVTYQIYSWGVDLPAALLTYALIIVMAGVLVSTRFAFLITAITVITISLIRFAEYLDILKVDRYWATETEIIVSDLIVIFIMFFVIAAVSWLSNREIEKSLTRARRSEADLKKEHASLEKKVEARTRELKETQAEKMIQLYRFAEFGRLSAGLFHDLINPLTAVSLNIERVKNAGETKQYVNKAISAARKMEDMVSAVRKQLSRQETKTLFSVNKEIAQALEVLSYKAQKSGVAIRLLSREEVQTYGDAVKFNQVALNLVANAIDAYLEKRDGKIQTIIMSLYQEGDVIIFKVKDGGIGISEENKPKLFKPFFTTKEGECGLGIGLSMIKRIIEKDFDGSISVESKEGKGATFTVKFPQKQNE